MPPLHQNLFSSNQKPSLEQNGPDLGVRHIQALQQNLAQSQGQLSALQDSNIRLYLYISR